MVGRSNRIRILLSFLAFASACTGLTRDSNKDSVDSTPFEVALFLIATDPRNVCNALASRADSSAANIGQPYAPYCGRRWPGGVVPFVIDPGLGIPERIPAALTEWESKTVVRFVPYTNQSDHVVFRSGAGCTANIGIIGTGPQIVILADLCPVSTVIHEIGHVLGLSHEHTRPDRDAHVIINWDNIWSFDRSDFFIESGLNRDWESAYDISSIMHYSSNAFFNGSGPTIVKKDGSLIDAPAVLSAGDIAAVNAIYGGP